MSCTLSVQEMFWHKDSGLLRCDVATLDEEFLPSPRNTAFILKGLANTEDCLSGNI